MSFAAAAALVLCGCGKKSTGELIELAKSNESADRARAVQSLGERGKEADAVVPILVASLKDQDAFVRRDAARSLGRIGPAAGEAVPALRSAARDKNQHVRQAAAVGSCTAALHLSVLAAGIGPGDEVITTPLTFCATINAIVHAGATPVLADVNPLTMNIDPTEVENRITSKTRAILPVHFAGRSCHMDALTAIADRYGLKLVEDFTEQA